MPKVFLSAGHGGNDNGATANGLREDELNLQILLSCKEVLERHNVNVICSRLKDEADPVEEEVKEANASKCDVAVSFHNNAGGGDGFEVFYYETSNEGKKLASLCEAQIKALGQNSRGLKSGNHLYFIRKTTMPALITETFFLDNVKDKAFGDSGSKLEKIGEAYAKAILSYFDINYVSKASESVPKDYEAIGKAFESCLNEIKTLNTYKNLMKLL